MRVLQSRVTIYRFQVSQIALFVVLAREQIGVLLIPKFKEMEVTGMKLVIAEKPSVAMSLAAVLGANEKKDGYMEGGG